MFYEKLTGNTDIEDSLSRLDKLTQEEARMASAELLKMTSSIAGQVMCIDDRVKGVDGKVQDVSNNVHGVRSDVSRYHIRLEAAHTILTQACLSTLLRLDDRIDQDNIENFPLAQYAAQYWAIHARFENASSHIKDGMECLFDADKPHLATWLWIYNEDRDGDYSYTRSTMCSKKPETVPLYYAARLGFRDLAEHLIAKHPEHVNAGREGSVFDARCGV